MIHKVDSQDLQIGMYVDSLDRPWIETDFMFQGFRISNQEELDSLRRQTVFVYVDDEKGDPPQPKAKVSPVRADMQQYEKQLRQVEAELKQAYAVHSLIKTSLSFVMQDMRLGKSVGMEDVQDAIRSMIQSIMRNPDALLLLGRIEQSDDDAANHALNCSIIALTFGRYMGLVGEQLETFGLAALLHDVGETELPDDLMIHGTPKSDEERALVQSHTALGRSILKKTPGMPSMVLDIAYSHHERVDGSGYPMGLVGDNISPFARMMALIDVYEWTTSGVGGKALTSPEVTRYLYSHRGTMFDKMLTEKFIQCLGIYPVGCLVELVKGDVGVVVSVPEDARLFPRLVLILDPDKKPYYPPRLINLSKFRDGEHAEEYAIKKVLPRDAYGFDFNAYIHREMGLDKTVAG